MVVSLPGKKVLFLIIACVVGVSIVGFAVYSTKSSGKQTDGTSLASGENSKTVGIIDRTLKKNDDNDGDGLLDWEESLWGTDSGNADSDGDETGDGDEVKLNRNPLKPGPDDKLLTENAGAKTDKKEVPLETTTTARISRELFANYMKAKRAGGPLNADVQNQIIKQTFKGELGSPSKQYALSDVKIADGNDLRKYGNDLGQAFYIGATQNSVSEIEILNTALTRESPEEIAKLDPIINGYSAILNKIASVSAPQNMLGYHLELLNGISRFLTDIKDFRLIFDDPMVGLIGVGNYYPDLDAMKTSLDRIKVVFASGNVFFEQSESGRFFQTI